MIYVTGDTHGNFSRIAHFCARMNTKPDDIMIILGDAGINFYGGWRDRHKKEFISKLPITLFCILAGYKNEMKEMLSTNPGMESRIQFTLEFVVTYNNSSICISDVKKMYVKICVRNHGK